MSVEPVPFVLTRQQGVDIIRDNLLRTRGFGSASRISVFTEDLAALHRLARLHCVTLPASEDCDVARSVILHHLVTGRCALPPDSGGNGKRPSVPLLCSQISGSFSSSRELSTAVLGCVVDSMNVPQRVPVPRLIAIANSLPVLRRVPVGTSVMNRARDARIIIQGFFDSGCQPESLPTVRDIFTARFEGLSRPELVAVAHAHKLDLAGIHLKVDLQNLIYDHVASGRCLSSVDVENLDVNSCACDHAVRSFLTQDKFQNSPQFFQLYVIAHGSVKIQLRPLRRLLTHLKIPFDRSASLSSLRTELRRFLRRLLKAKNREFDSVQEQTRTYDNLRSVRETWPQPIPDSVKAGVIDQFKKLTSKEGLVRRVCASCSELVPAANISSVDLESVYLPSLSRPDSVQYEDVDERREGLPWLEPDFPEPPMPFPNGPLKDLLVEPDGVVVEDGRTYLLLCKTCRSSVDKKRVPPCALSNRLYLGSVPPELRDLTVVEEAMIALCRSKCWIVQLHEQKDSDTVVPTYAPDKQRGVKGNIIIYPQRVSVTAQKLPPSIEEITSPLCVLFVGSRPPTPEWLRLHAKPLAVNGARVRRALVWLKQNNSLYRDIEINEEVLQSLESNPILPFHIDYVHHTDGLEERTSGYDPAGRSQNPAGFAGSSDNPVVFDKVVISDINCSATVNQLRSAAFRHVQKKGGGYIELPHDPTPVNEFNNPKLLPMIYPTLFPYGLGGSDDRSRLENISLARQVRHFFSLADRRFQEHHSFLFTVFNILQRREMLLRASLKVKRSSFTRLASSFADVTPESIHTVVERLQNGGQFFPRSDDERRVYDLMKEVQAVSTHVPGSPASKTTMRNEIRALMIDQGLPSFYVTINPADILNPVVRFLAGSDIDPDTVTASMYDYMGQKTTVAKNPFVAAEFFNLYMRTLVDALMQFEPDPNRRRPGVFGRVSAYYGCVEAQGRGTLHCHMVVWLEGGLNPDQIKDRVLADKTGEFQRRLISFLDDTISNAIPPDPASHLPSYSPCCVRGPPRTEGLPPEVVDLHEKKDYHLLTKECQIHVHGKTCYKYSATECRFDIDASNYRPVSSFNEDGELSLGCLDGVVNNFNETILKAVRCNMDLKFIGSGVAAKAILYYITDYITKSQLKAHIAYAALERSVTQLSRDMTTSDSVTLRGKRLLQRCAYSLISHQELSAQQVAAYLMDYGDHYTSHSFVNLPWVMFERYPDEQLPSPECYRNSRHGEDKMKEDDRPSDLDVDGDLIVDEPAFECPDNDGDANTTYRQFESDADREEEEHPPDITLGPLVSDDAVPVDLNTGADEDDFIPIVIDKNGDVRAKASLVDDYVARGSTLSDVCLWDYVSRVKKISKKEDSKRVRPTEQQESIDDDTDPMHWLSDDESDNEEENCAEQDTRTTDLLNEIEQDPLLVDLHIHSNPHLASTKRKRGRIPFTVDHPQHESYHQVPSAWLSRKVVVPVGPGIPRRDIEDVQHKHARLMLILFKPWTTVIDLRCSASTWMDAYREFFQSAAPRIQFMINNMQVLHECKDSRDDHYAARQAERRRRRAANFRDAGNEEEDSIEVDDGLAGETVDAEILTHLLRIERAISNKVDHTTTDVLDTIQNIEQAGMFPGAFCYESADEMSSLSLDPGTSWSSMIRHEKDVDKETTWTKQYKQRHDLDRSRSMNISDTSAPSRFDNNTMPDTAGGINDGSAFRQAFSSNVPCEPRLRQPFAEPAPLEVNLEDVARDWTLNSEQKLAFEMVARHADQIGGPPLGMILSGPGGTGKSQVINALMDYFTRRGETRRFRLASFTGIAARNVSGMTLHSALLLGQLQKRKNISSVKADLIAKWDGVDFLFVDEYSMISASLLHDISYALSLAKENDLPFGGINVIFAGDFAQLPPVRSKRLYHPVIAEPEKGKSGRSVEERTLIGRLLWLSLSTCVVLTEIMRQRTGSPDTKRFVELLGRLRVGRCTQSDYSLLQSRLATRQKMNWSDPDWQEVPIIVKSNAAKDRINELAAEDFARRTGQELHWYYATDRFDGTKIADPSVRTYLTELPSNVTGGRLGRIPLALGMPVMITTNFDVEAGIVNGSPAKLVSVRYWVDSLGYRHATSCVVQCEGLEGEPLIDLEMGQAAVIEDTKELVFAHPRAKKKGEKLKVKRTQLPLVPGFAMTAHKAQGLSLDKVVVDLQSCSGSESPYVMLSRVRSLGGLVILRPFSFKRISCQMSQDLRTELTRQELLSLVTKANWGSDSASAAALDELKSRGLDHLVALPAVVSIDSFEEATYSLVQAIQQAVSDQIASYLNVGTERKRAHTNQTHTSSPRRNVRRRID